MPQLRCNLDAGDGDEPLSDDDWELLVHDEGERLEAEALRLAESETD